MTLSAWCPVCVYTKAVYIAILCTSRRPVYTCCLEYFIHATSLLKCSIYYHQVSVRGILSRGGEYIILGIILKAMITSEILIRVLPMVEVELTFNRLPVVILYLRNILYIHFL